MENIEIKATFKNIENGKLRASSIGAEYVGCDHQIDTYFKTPKGRFKLRQSSISGNYLVPYLREDSENSKSSFYILIPVNELTEVKHLFSEILGVDTVVEKNRHIYIKDNVRIHLDEVKNLGTFFELEAVCDENSIVENEHKKVADLLNIFEVADSDLLTGSYKEIIKK